MAQAARAAATYTIELGHVAAGVAQEWPGAVAARSGSEVQFAASHTAGVDGRLTADSAVIRLSALAASAQDLRGQRIEARLSSAAAAAPSGWRARSTYSSSQVRYVQPQRTEPLAPGFIICRGICFQTSATALGDSFRVDATPASILEQPQ